MTHCYVCGADPSSPCRAVDGEIAECPRPRTFREIHEAAQAECRQILRAKHFNQVERGDEK